jgi:hypothetical protein
MEVLTLAIDCHEEIAPAPAASEDLRAFRLSGHAAGGRKAS